MDNFGTSDSGYFVSRQALLDWINHTLKLQLTHIEQLGTGAIYCQLLDSLYPGHIPLNRVNWKARQEYEFLQNFKVLQGALDRLGIDKKIEVSCLAKGRYHENLETIQWMKRYIELHGGPEPNYDPVSRRGKAVVELHSTRNRQRQTNKQNDKCTDAPKAALNRHQLLATTQSFDLLSNHRPQLAETKNLLKRKLENVRSVDNLQKEDVKSSKPLIKFIHRHTGSAHMASPKASTMQPSKQCTTEADEESRIQKILRILSEKTSDKAQIRKIREVVGWKPDNPGCLGPR